MRQFSILVVFVLAFGGAAVLYEKESRKVKGVLTQITELQAQLGDLQAEVNRLTDELEAVKLVERGPDLKVLASRIRSEERPPSDRAAAPATGGDGSRRLTISDVTEAPPVIHSGGDEEEEEEEWNRPTVDAELYREQQEPPQDPYQ